MIHYLVVSVVHHLVEPRQDGQQGIHSQQWGKILVTTYTNAVIVVVELQYQINL